MTNFYHLTIKELKKEALNAVSISFSIPESLKSKFTFIPGQYITIQKELNGEQVRRDYSICTSQNSGELKVGIKAVENGLFSQYAVNELKVGDELEVSEPKGRFNLKTNTSNTKNYIAFAAGSGITPILSMVTSALENEQNSKFVLAYGNKTAEEVMFKSEIDTLSQQYQNRFFPYYVYSKAKYDGNLEGRIGEQTLDLLLDVNHKDLKFDDFFLCGPEQMINLVKDSLAARGINKNAIHFELFTASAEANTEIVEENLEGDTAIKIILDDEEAEFSMPKNRSILEGAMLEGLDPPYSCQGGICSSCLAKVTEGKAIMEKNSILDEDEIAEGLILTCQAHAVTPKIVVDFDDV